MNILSRFCSTFLFAVSLVLGFPLALFIQSFINKLGIFPKTDASSQSILFLIYFVLMAFGIQLLLRTMFRSFDIRFSNKLLSELSQKAHSYIYVKRKQEVTWLKNFLFLEHTAFEDAILKEEGQYRFKPTTDTDRIILKRNPLSDVEHYQKSGLSFVSPLLTALGVLGTFWGISQGLLGFGTLDGLDSARLLEKMKPLLGGMSTAFVTSLVGIGASVIFILSEKVMESILKMQLRHQKDLLNKHFALDNPTRYLRSQQSSDMAGVAESMSKVAEEMKSAAMQMNMQGLGQVVSSAITTSLQPLVTQNQKNGKVMEQLLQKQDRFGEELLTQFKTTLFGPLQNALEQNSVAMNATREAMESTRQSVDSLRGILNEQVTQMQAVVKQSHESLDT
ncbi:MAG TPA: hypothetical protein DCE42_22385, partial [Myxococcales bacterium]|nr:hypothetical protein [Myxococcales bacterium]